MRNHCRTVLLLAIVVAACLLVSPAGAVDTDGDGLLDLIDVPGFDQNARGRVSFTEHVIEDLDGANLLTNAQELILWRNQITSIEIGDFAGLSNLTFLSLWGNRITSIESGDFEDLTNLNRLRLGGNQITGIESGDFEGLTNLKWLDLHNNPITSVESGDFESLTNLQSLDLQDNRITSIEDGDFDGPTNLQELWLWGNQITSIESGDFAGLSSLTFLSLWGNQITSIESGGFTGLTNLQELVLTGNEFSELNFTGATFENLKQCRLGERGFCVDGDEITSLILDEAVLSRESLNVILAETLSISDMSLVGLKFSDENAADLHDLFAIGTLNNVTVDQALVDLYAEEFNTFAAMEGKSLTVVFAEDFNRDGTVNFPDFLEFAAVFAEPGTGDNLIYDLDDSLAIDFGDFLQFSAAFGQTTNNVATVPEPESGLLLFIISGLAIAERRFQRMRGCKFFGHVNKRPSWDV